MNEGISEVRASVSKQVAEELLIKQLRTASLIFGGLRAAQPATSV